MAYQEALYLTQHYYTLNPREEGLNSTEKSAESLYTNCQCCIALYPQD